MAAESERTIGETRYEITPLELFFDLVFVFGVSQLARHLLNDLSWQGAGEMLVMLVAIFGAWFTTSWSATIVPANRAETRLLMFTVMLLSLFMNASVTRAFTTGAWVFVVPLLAIQLGRTVWTLVNAPDAVQKEHYWRTLAWAVATAPLWLAGAWTNPAARLMLWALAAAIDLIGRWTAHPVPGRRLHSDHVPFDAGHMLERCRLFLIIALGETVVTTGFAMAEEPLTLMTAATGTASLVSAIALWTISFGRSHTIIMRHLAQTTDPILTSRHAVNALTVLVVGLIAIAVASEDIIAHPLDPTPIALSLLLGGGPASFLAAQAWYLRVVSTTKLTPHFIGIAVLLIAGLATASVPRFFALLLVGAVLAILAGFDQRRELMPEGTRPT
jgi:low temperature requirement protein LtrA